MLEKPCFLVGSERSGTTLLRLMLSHHPSIGWCEEFEYAVSQMDDAGNFPELSKYHGWLSSDRIFRSADFRIDPQLSYPELVDDFLQQRLQKTGKEIMGATVHHHFDRLLKIWPDARFIHIYRDPRDVARSAMGMGWAGNVWIGSDIWVTAESLWASLVPRLSSDRYIEVKYEDLISTPETILTAICQYLGYDYDSLMLSYAENSTYDLPDPKLVYQWRKKLSDYEIQLVEAKTSEYLVKLGYELSGLPPLSLKEKDIQKLRFQNYWYKVNFRLKRYGLYLLASDYLSRKLKLHSWQKQVKLKMNEIAKEYIK